MSETPHDPRGPGGPQEEGGLPRDPVDQPGFENTPSGASDEGGPETQARHASVRLREESEDHAAMMDPANQSLADALRITYALVQVAMVVLAALFIFSGFQTVREGERGLSLLFGKAVRNNLEPGFHFSAPYPFGELVKIGTGNEQEKLLREFWPYVQEGYEEDSIERVAMSMTLDPTRDGSVITADLNLAHTQWLAVYRRTDPIDFVRNIPAEEEDGIVRAALSRGVVRVMATVTIDELLRPQAGGTRLISQRALEIAQDTLDSLNSGITIEQFEMSRRTPPAYLLSKFQAVLDARSQAQQVISEARTTRDTRLNETAGAASAGLLWLIDEYERVLELEGRDAAEDVLARIDRVLAGEPFTLTDAERERLAAAGGSTAVLEADGRVASGAVTEVIQTAEVDAVRMVEEARSDAELFAAKLEQFRVNPKLMVSRDWSSAWTAFQTNDFVQSFTLPANSEGRYVLWLNEDPDIVKDLDRAQKQQARERTADERMRELRNRQYQGDRGEVQEDR